MNEFDRLTIKQLEILSIVLGGNPDPHRPGDALVDMDQLLERLSYEPTKQSLQFSIRALVKRGLIDKGPEVSRRGRRRITFSLTQKGREMLPASSEQEPVPFFSAEELEIYLGAGV